MSQTRPTTCRPFDRLKRSLAPEDATAMRADRTAAQVSEIPAPARGLDQGAMAGLLQQCIGSSGGREKWIVRTQFVRSRQTTRTCQSDGMRLARAAFRGHEVVITIALVEMWSLSDPKGRTAKNIDRRADQTARHGGKFLQCDAGKLPAVRPGIPDLIEQPLAPVVIVEQGWIESTAVQRHRLAPRPGDVHRSDEIIPDIFGAAIERLDV